MYTNKFESGQMLSQRVTEAMYWEIAWSYQQVALDQLQTHTHNRHRLHELLQNQLKMQQMQEFWANAQNLNAK